MNNFYPNHNDEISPYKRAAAFIPVEKFQYRPSKTSKSKKAKKEGIKLWRKSLKKELMDLSSREFQRKVWIDQSVPDIIWHFGEAMCIYFDDFRMNEKSGAEDEGLHYHISQEHLTKEEAEILRPFNKALNKYCDNTSSYPTTEEYKKILSDPKWIKITQMAKEILEKIDFDQLPKLPQK